MNLKVSSFLLAFAGLLSVNCAMAGNLLPGDSSFEAGFGDIGLAAASGRIQIKLDAATAAHGIQSVKLADAAGRVISKPFKGVSPDGGEELVLSLFAKAERDGVQARLFLYDFKGNNAFGGTAIKLTREWRRYSMSAQSKGGDVGVGIDILSPGAVWIDAIQLEAGKTPSDYADNGTLSLGVNIPNATDYVFFKDEEIPVELQAVDFDGKAGSGESSISYQVSDCFGKTLLKDVRKAVFKDGHAALNCKIKPPSLGWLRISAELVRAGKVMATASRAVAVVERPVEIKEGLLPFCGNCHAYVMRSTGMKRIGGLNWFDVGLRWSNCEPVKSEYRFPDIGRLQKEGFKIKLTLGHFISAPQWAWDPEDVANCERLKIKQPSNGFLPSKEHMESWRAFIRQLANTYKGQVDFIEFGAEDDLTFGGNPYYLRKQKDPANVKFGKLVGGPDYGRYAEMLRIACEEVKKVAPEMKVGIVRPSGGDCTVMKYAFSGGAIAKCGKLFDFFPLDPYCGARYLGPDKPATPFPEDFLPDALGNALATCREKGAGQNVYISELGYALDYNVPPEGDYSIDMVKRLARLYLVARMTPGVELMHWFHPNPYGCIEGGKYHYGLWRFGMPLPVVPAYSAVARIVENVEGVKEFQVGGDSKAVVFRKDGRADSAIWFVRGHGRLVCDVWPEGLAVTDVMGNPVEPKTVEPSIWDKAYAAISFTAAPTQRIIDIGELPVYFGLKGAGSFDALCDALSQARMICEPVSLSLLTPRSDTGTLLVRNMVREDVFADISIAMDGVANPRGSIKVGKGAVEAVAIPLNGKASTVSVSVDCGDGYDRVAAAWPVSFERCAKVKFQGRIDGDLSKWAGRPFITMNERGQIMPSDPWIDWRGPEHFRAKVYTGWDDKNLYLAAEVGDDVHMNGFPSEIWKGDCLQFALDPKADAGAANIRAGGYGKDDFELGLALTSNGVSVAQWVGAGNVWKDSEYAVKRAEAAKTTFYEMRIPLRSLGLSPASGSVFGFSFVIPNDDTGAGANYWYQLSPGIAGGKNPALFKKFVLER